MKHQHACTNKKCICNVIAPYMLKNIAAKGNEAQRAVALRTLGQDIQLRAERMMQLENKVDEPRAQASATLHKKRLVHTATS